MKITALILAAGSSKRMGQPKMLLPWGNTTVLGQVIETLQSAGIEDIVVVTGGAREEVEKIVTRYSEASPRDVIRSIHNPDHAAGEMLSSIQVGIRELTSSRPPPFSPKIGVLSRSDGGGQPDALLLCLGDQPQMEARSVRAVAGKFSETRAALVVPSHQMRRGHPWILARPLWKEVEALRPPQTMRDFLNGHAGEIEYVNVESPSILADLDTPEDYQRAKPLG